jgi:hypothetical protein
MTEQQTGAKELGQIQLVFLELPKYDTSRPPRTMVEKWAYFFREADNLSVVPEELAEHPFIDALEAARTAGFTADEWETYILAGIAIQNERGALAVAERRGEQRGMRQGVEGLCRVLGIELTDDRRRELANLNAAELAELLARLVARRSWTCGWRHARPRTRETHQGARTGRERDARCRHAHAGAGPPAVSPASPRSAVPAEWNTTCCDHRHERT